MRGLSLKILCQAAVGLQTLIEIDQGAYDAYVEMMG